MPCPTCGHTMECLAPSNFAAPGIFWCPRCGTIRNQTDINNIDCVPKLVERCREFYQGTLPYGYNWQNWNRLGIHESIYPPEDRQS